MLLIGSGSFTRQWHDQTGVAKYLGNLFSFIPLLACRSELSRRMCVASQFDLYAASDLSLTQTKRSLYGRICRSLSTLWEGQGREPRPDILTARLTGARC